MFWGRYLPPPQDISDDLGSLFVTPSDGWGLGVVICPHITISLMVWGHYLSPPWDAPDGFGVVICPHIIMFLMDEGLGSLFVPTLQ